MIQAVIFDMDGLMVDSEPLHYQAYKQVLADMGIALSMQDYFLFWGTDKEMCARVVKNLQVPVLPEELLARKNTVFRNVFIHTIAPKKGLMELLNFLQDKKRPLAVASGSQLHEIEIVLNAIGARKFFKEIVSAESVAHGKPAPDCYLLAAKMLNVMPAECLALEDMPGGVLAAKAAGITCFAVPSHGLKDMDFSAADAILENLEAACELLKKDNLFN